jgi:zinc D-Ala-D-Ala carboxypeptidase
MEYRTDATFTPSPDAPCTTCGEALQEHRKRDQACPIIDEDDLPDGYLTPHFTLAEMVYSDTANACGIDNSASPDIVDNLTRLCGVLEEIRTLCGDNPVSVSSGYRCTQLNSAVGGVSDSAHLYGLAADISIPAYGNPTVICQNLQPHLGELGIDQLIDETSGTARWVHVGLCEGEPRNECFAL